MPEVVVSRLNLQLRVDVMKLNIVDGSTVSLSDEVFERDYNEALVHQAVITYMAGGRSGTKAQKTRSDVSGGGAKPWRQKGTGRARAGTSRGPIWRKGGVTFAARPRNHSKKLNKKMYRVAISSIFSELIRADSLVVVKDFAVSKPSTKGMVARLDDLSVSDVLLVGVEIDTNTSLSVRNIPNCDVVAVGSLDPVGLVTADKVVITEAAIKKVEEWLS